MKKRGRKPITNTSNLKTLYKVELTPEQFETIIQSYNLSLSKIDIDVRKIDEKVKISKVKQTKLKIIDILNMEPNLSIAEIAQKLKMCREGISNNYGNFIRAVKAGEVMPITKIFETES